MSGKLYIYKINTGLCYEINSLNRSMKLFLEKPARFADGKQFFFLLFILLFLAAGHLFAQNEKNVRSFDRQAMENYRKDSSFDYARKAAEPSLIDQLKSYILQKIAEYFVQNPKSFTVLRYALYGIGSVLLIYILFRMIGADFSSLFGKNNQKSTTGFSAPTEANLLKTDFAVLLEKARLIGDHSEAVRLYYLFALRRLAEAGLLVPKAGKTNSDYAGELPAGEIKTGFRKLTYVFDCVHYGEFAADERIGNYTQSHFDKLCALIKK